MGGSAYPGLSGKAINAITCMWKAMWRQKLETPGHKLRNTCGHWNLENHGLESPLEFPERVWLSTFISEFQHPMLISVILSYHICGHLLQQPGGEYTCFSLLASVLSLKDFRHTPGPGKLHLSYFWLKNCSPRYLNGLSSSFLKYHLPDHRIQHCDPQYSCPALYFFRRHLIHLVSLTNVFMIVPSITMKTWIQLREGSGSPLFTLDLQCFHQCLWLRKHSRYIWGKHKCMREGRNQAEIQNPDHIVTIFASELGHCVKMYTSCCYLTKIFFF